MEHMPKEGDNNSGHLLVGDVTAPGKALGHLWTPSVSWKVSIILSILQTCFQIPTPQLLSFKSFLRAYCVWALI